MQVASNSCSYLYSISTGSHVFYCRLSLLVLVFLSGCGSDVPVRPAATRSPVCMHSSFPPFCYGPHQIEAAYDIVPLLSHGVDGRGRTVVIVGFGSSAVPAGSAISLQKSLHAYDDLFHLPTVRLRTVTPFGRTLLSERAGVEVAQDVETVHMVAPRATIVVALARAPESKAASTPVRRQVAQAVLLYIRDVEYVVRHNLGDVISLSFVF